jgi:hypothetical protein
VFLKKKPQFNDSVKNYVLSLIYNQVGGGSGKVSLGRSERQMRTDIDVFFAVLKVLLFLTTVYSIVAVVYHVVSFVLFLGFIVVTRDPLSVFYYQYTDNLALWMVFYVAVISYSLLGVMSVQGGKHNQIVFVERFGQSHKICYESYFPLKPIETISLFPIVSR